MDFQRILAIAGFSFASLILWQEWQKVNNPQAVNPTTAVVQSSANNAGVPSAPIANQSGVPQVAPKPPAVQDNGSYLQYGQRIKVRSHVADIEIDTLGGDVRYLAFRKHFEADDTTKTKPLVFFDDKNINKIYVPQSGLLGGTGLPTHKAKYELAPNQPTQFTLGDKDKKANVHLIHTTPDGIIIHKYITIYNDRYLINVAYHIENKSKNPINNLNAYFQLVRHDQAPAGDPRFVSTYTGVATYTDTSKFSKIKFEDIQKNKMTLPAESKDGWVAMLQHYFLSAWLPMDNMFKRDFYAKKLEGNLYTAGMILPMEVIPAGGTMMFTIPLYAGPQEQDNLENIAKGLEYAVDYGWLTPIAKPIFWGLSGIHNTTGNWGIAIILLTVFIKLVLSPLSAKSYKSMAQMRILAPKLEQIKQRAGDDKMALQRDMIDLYRREKINPLGGCLPMVAQMPIFIALYWVVLYSVEIRQAPLALWIQDLSIPDPYFVFPIIMMLTMIFQVRLNPTPPDPIQAKMAMIMPVAFGVFFFFFPAGLVMYWIVNNILSIGQQWYITNKIENQAKQPVVLTK